jgi:diacylglycerol kinase (ATP)
LEKGGFVGGKTLIWLHWRRSIQIYIFDHLYYAITKTLIEYILKIRNFIVFINPISGTKNKDKTRTIIENELTQHHFTYQFLPTEKSGDYSFLKTKVEKENITDIIICGGDGTVNNIGAYLQNLKVNVGIIPMGSGNGLAFTAGISKAPKKAMAIIVHGKASYVDAFLVNNEFACHNFGVGFDAQVAHEFATGKNRGPFNYIKLTAKNYFKAKPISFKVEVFDTKINTEAFFITVSNSNQFGNSLTIAPKASLNDGLLDVVLVKKANKFSLFFKLIHQLKHGTVANVTDGKKTFHYFQTKKIIIYNPTKAPIHIDGEPMKTTDIIEIKIIEKAFKLIQP